ncbi:MAG: cyclic nucleotide-binding domain-containing protein [Wenzhouxiangellaceae bacterium]|nr:cyclic nucleotide-binding domain-containing protein [Wenzhouxiangellaceae bacterium]
MSKGIDGQKLKNSFLGEELEAREIEALKGVFTVKDLAEGEILVNEDDLDFRLFLLAEGRLEVLSMQEGELEHVYLMQPGEFAGTRAFVDRTPRSATLRARTDAVLYSLEPEQFESLVETHPWLVYKIMRALFRITHVNLMRMNKEARELANYVFKRGGRY